MEEKEGNTRRIVLLGKSGSGKSSLANTLFEKKNTFKVSDSANSVTRLCQSKTKTINGRIIQLIDTPGFFDTDSKGDELKLELIRCMTKCASGIHSFLLVFPFGRFTPQEQEVVNQMVNCFDEESLKYTTVVFTRGADLKRGKKIEDWLEDNKSLKELVEKCGGRCCVFDNKYWNKAQRDPYRNNQYQIKELLKKIDQTVRENRGGCYTNEMLQMVQKKLEEKKIEIKLSSPKSSEKSCNKKASGAVNNFLVDILKGVAIGAICGVFLGGAAGLLFTSAVVKYAVAGAVVGAVVGGVVGALVSECAEPVAEAADFFQKERKHYKSE